MSNNSATGGFLVPAESPAPLGDQNFEDFLQEYFVGITGLPGELVFPRWQPEPPNLPDVGTDWAAFGITDTDADTFAVELHNGDGDGSSELQRHELVTTLASAYGPNSYRTMATFRDGVQIAQNREILTRNGIGLVDTGRIVSFPRMVKGKWLHRMDMRWTIRRAVFRSYPVLNLLRAQGTIATVDLTTTINA